MLIGPSLPSVTLGSAIQETFWCIDHPQHSLARELVAVWDERPDDGLQLGRDIPSRKMARTLANLLIWEPVEDGNDFRLFLMGEVLRFRFGGNATGRYMSELLDPEIYTAFQMYCRTMLSQDNCDCFDVKLSQDASRYALQAQEFELVMMPIYSRTRSRLVLTGSFYL